MSHFVAVTASTLYRSEGISESSCLGGCFFCFLRLDRTWTEGLRRLLGFLAGVTLFRFFLSVERMETLSASIFA